MAFKEELLLLRNTMPVSATEKADWICKLDVPLLPLLTRKLLNLKLSVALPAISMAPLLALAAAQVPGATPMQPGALPLLISTIELSSGPLMEIWPVRKIGPQVAPWVTV